MGNFDFVRQTLPNLHDGCARAESYLSSDPRTACFYSRRVVENLVLHLYDLLNLRAPYRDDLAARIGDPGFGARVPVGIIQKLNIIRRVANTAVHDPRQVGADVSRQLVRELFAVIVWASYHHSPHPDVVPLQAQFDPALAAKAAPLSRDEVARLAQKFAEQDAAHARALADRDERLAAHESEIARLRAQIAAAQADAAPDTRDYDEADARDLFIDVLLREAGWRLDEARDREYEVTGMPSADGRGYVDYVLWGADGLPLAVVEAKRTSHSPEVGQQQAKLYADCLEAQFGRRPVIFYTNGYEHRIWDDAGGYPPREIDGFFTRDELELLLQRRRTQLPLSTAPVDTQIAGRPYQVRAVKAVADAFDRRQRQALLVMATGSGKTRTVIALVDLLQRASWAKRVLFLADRTALVTQAANAFKAHLPGSTTVNLVTEKAVEGRIYVSTYPTMMNLIDEVDNGLRRFGPGYFDLIVIDEAHRSVYAKYGAIFDYFDALLVGLTATPKDEVDHNTYRLFHLEDGVPTDSYSLDEAVGAGYLVPPKGVSVGLQFVRAGIRYDDLTEDEKDQWDALDWGEGGPPDEVGAEEINRFLFNEDTVDKVLKTLMVRGYKVAGADRLGKTIVFAKNQKHAEFIQKRFDYAYPELAGSFARVITHASPYAQSLIDDFSTPGKAPHIAISVDMLDTGIDVPDVVNLVFFKMVRSKSKFWQMIGRGTRLRPDLFGPGEDKSDFLVFDFCGNLEYFSQDLPGSQGETQKSLSQCLFEARIGLVVGLDDREPELRDSTEDLLRDIVAGMTLDNFVVRPHRRAVEQFSEPVAWNDLTPTKVDALMQVAGLPSSLRDEDEDAKRFDLLILRRQLAQLDGDIALGERVREAVQQIAAALLGKTAIPSVAAQAVLLESVASDEWWADVTLPMLELVRIRMRGLARFIEHKRRNPIYTDFEDSLSSITEIALPGVTPGTNYERFQSKAEAYLRQHLDNLALQRLRRSKQLTTSDVTELESMLVASGAGPVDIAFATKQIGGLGVFVRRLVGLERAAATEAFEAYLDGTRFSADQIRFVTLVVDELTKNGVMEPGRLFESPYTDHAPTGPDFYFGDSDVDIIVESIRAFTRTAVPDEAA
ncbi:DEAD/DEAH box helicase family protein [Herbiconiux liukaitaii]|uniref:DEAD/DEAH box helicase family protein n=1 Tax=Herbiconiux liukaitaii TaxID=3342799 RepID=UPI0035B6DFC9